MTRHKFLQAPTTRVEQPARPLHVAHQPVQVAAGSPYLTLAEGARHCRFDVTAPGDPVNAFRRWLHRDGVPLVRRGRVLLVERAVLDAFMAGESVKARR